MNRRSVVGLILAVTAGSVVLGQQVSGQASTERVASPLASYLGFGHWPDLEDKQYDQDEQARQAFITSCMSEAGFDYWQRPPDIVVEAGSPAPDQTLPEDRNEGYVRSLPKEQRTAYAEALTGRTSDSEELTPADLKRYDADGDGKLTYAERADRGCVGKSEHAVPGVFYVTKVLEPELAAMEQEIGSDPRVVAAEDAWVDCVAPVTDVTGSYEAVNRRLYEHPEKLASPASSQLVQDCDEQLRQAAAPARVDHERDFFEANKKTIEELALPGPG